MDNISPSIIRQTPPPPLTPAAGKEGKIKPEMVGSNNRSTHTYYLPADQDCKNKSLKDIESLPDEVLFEVLVRLQAQDIYDSARLVCSKWYHMTHTHTFIYAHLQHSTYGLLFQSKYWGDSFFMAVGESGRVEISQNRYKPKSHVPTSCNGLVLELELPEGSNYNFYVSNPATRQMFALPPFVDNTINDHVFSIAYAAASMEYKAVLLLCRGEKRMCFILTIGVDKSWRTVVGMECVSTYVFMNTPLITEGFVHWYDVTNSEVLTMNVETEIITKTIGPIPRVVYGNRQNIFLSTGRYLSLLRPCGEFCWEAWEMKPNIDYQWRKVCDISLEPRRYNKFHCIHQYYNFYPTGWLKYPEVLVFFTTDIIRAQTFVFYLLTKEIVPIDLPFLRTIYNILVHKNSLVWLAGC